MAKKYKPLPAEGVALDVDWSASLPVSKSVEIISVPQLYISAALAGLIARLGIDSDETLYSLAFKFGTGMAQYEQRQQKMSP